MPTSGSAWISTVGMRSWATAMATLPALSSPLASVTVHTAV